MSEVVERREELLEKVVDVLLAKGISGLSLRPLGEAVGSRARLLIYHFGSKEELLSLALDRVRTRIYVAINELVAREGIDSLEDFLRMFWRWALEETNQRYFRLLFEIDGLSMHESEVVPAKSRGAGVDRWIEALGKRLNQLSVAPERRRGVSTLTLAAFTGLLHDYFSSGDLVRTTEGVEFLIEALVPKTTITTGKTREGY